MFEIYLKKKPVISQNPKQDRALSIMPLLAVNSIKEKKRN